MKIYVASSWGNQHLQQAVVHTLRQFGHEVYDFIHPAPKLKGFSWSEIDSDWRKWSPEQFRAALQHPIAERGFRCDMDALRACDACVLVMPCGRSAHLELGYAVGAGKRTAVLLTERAEAELMYKMCDHICADFQELLDLFDPAKLQPGHASAC